MLFIDDPYHNRYYTTLRTLKVHNKKRRKIFTVHVHAPHCVVVISLSLML